jgi:hypothetical protein
MEGRSYRSCAAGSQASAPAGSSSHLDSNRTCRGVGGQQFSARIFSSWWRHCLRSCGGVPGDSQGTPRSSQDIRTCRERDWPGGQRVRTSGRGPFRATDLLSGFSGRVSASRNPMSFCLVATSGTIGLPNERKYFQSLVTFHSEQSHRRSVTFWSYGSAYARISAPAFAWPVTAIKMYCLPLCM